MFSKLKRIGLESFFYSMSRTEEKDLFLGVFWG